MMRARNKKSDPMNRVGFLGFSRMKQA